MTEPHLSSATTQNAGFHARVASVGLITTMVVLVMACLTFMMQQWAVAGAQSTQIYQSLGHITGATVASATRSGDTEAAQAALTAYAAERCDVRLDPSVATATSTTSVEPLSSTSAIAHRRAAATASSRVATPSLR